MFDPASFSLRNRVALVTGSSTGLGKAMLAGLGKAGAKVALNYQNNASRAEASFAEIEAAGIEGMLVRGDVTDEAEVGRMVDEISSKLGPVDILVFNATPPQPQKPIEEYDWALPTNVGFFHQKSLPTHSRMSAAYEGTKVGSHHQHRLGSSGARRRKLHRLCGGQRRAKWL